MLGNFSYFCCRLVIFFKIYFFKIFFQEHYQSVKLFAGWVIFLTFVVVCCFFFKIYFFKIFFQEHYQSVKLFAGWIIFLTFVVVCCFFFKIYFFKIFFQEHYQSVKLFACWVIFLTFVVVCWFFQNLLFQNTLSGTLSECQTLCMLGNFSYFCCRLLIFSKFTFSKYSIRNTIRVSNSLHAG